MNTAFVLTKMTQLAQDVVHFLPSIEVETFYAFYLQTNEDIFGAYQKISP